MSQTRTHGACANCRERFDLRERHIAFGGLLWCTDECLAEFVAASDGIDVDRVVVEMERRGETL